MAELSACILKSLKSCESSCSSWSHLTLPTSHCSLRCLFTDCFLSYQGVPFSCCFASSNLVFILDIVSDTWKKLDSGYLPSKSVASCSSSCRLELVHTRLYASLVQLVAWQNSDPHSVSSAGFVSLSWAYLGQVQSKLPPRAWSSA